VRWRLEFYSERRRTLARYSVEAPTPAAAQAQGLGDYRTLAGGASPPESGGGTHASGSALLGSNLAQRRV
jgi:hypothetical protein